MIQRFVGDLSSDIRYALRTLRSSPGFACAAILAIAIGIGINTGIFSVLNGLALRDLPAPESQRLVNVSQLPEGGTERRSHGAPSMFSTAEYERYRASTQTLSGLLASARPTPVTLGGDAPRQIPGSLVSCNYFDVLQQRPTVGRGFAADTCEAQQAAPEVVLGHDLWVDAFAADPRVVGRTVVLNRQSFTVAGVAPEGFEGVDIARASFFVPLSTQELLLPSVDYLRDEHLSWLTLVGRRAAGASIDQVRAELAVIAAAIDADDPGRKTALVIERATPFPYPELRPYVIGAGAVVMAGFALVLLIACANVANLLLARASTRGREIALRLSLGATRGRLIRQLLTESVLISVAGGVLGSLLALWSFRGLVAFVLTGLPADAPPMHLDSRPDLTVLAFAVGLTLLTGIAFGLAPAIHASNPALYGALKQDASAERAKRSRGVLVGLQVAVCLVLTICASLLLRGLYATQTFEPGFNYRDVAVASFNLEGAGYDAPQAAAFQRALLERVRALPGVTAAAQASRPPLRADVQQMPLTVPGQPAPQTFNYNAVSPDFFAVVDIPLARGRTFLESELDDRSTSIIVTEATARRVWPGEEPLGKTLVIHFPPNPRVELSVVGVTADASTNSIGRIDDDLVYLPASPRSQPFNDLMVRSNLDQAALATAIRDAAQAIDPGIIVRMGRLEDNLGVWRNLSTLVATLSGSLGLLALALASVGVYGLVAYAVSRKLREIGIRLALGATARDVLLLVLRLHLRPVIVGAAVGIVACLGAAPLLSSLMFGVSSFDPIALGGATLIVLGAAVAASLVPARRALRVDPMTTLRYE